MVIYLGSATIDLLPFFDLDRGTRALVNPKPEHALDTGRSTASCRRYPQSSSGCGCVSAFWAVYRRGL
jgi:hypothetical protein